MVVNNLRKKQELKIGGHLPKISHVERGCKIHMKQGPWGKGRISKTSKLMGRWSSPLKGRCMEQTG